MGIVGFRGARSASAADPSSARSSTYAKSARRHQSTSPRCDVSRDLSRRCNLGDIISPCTATISRPARCSMPTTSPYGRASRPAPVDQQLSSAAAAAAAAAAEDAAAADAAAAAASAAAAAVSAVSAHGSLLPVVAVAPPADSSARASPPWVSPWASAWASGSSRSATRSPSSARLSAFAPRSRTSPCDPAVCRHTEEVVTWRVHGGYMVVAHGGDRRCT